MKQTDKPKISPKTMKAADNINKEVIEGIAAYNYGDPTGQIAQIIDTATNLTAKEHALGELVELLPSFKRDHRYCEDSWYSCPLAIDGCADDRWDADECNCGAKEHNAKIDAALTTAKAALEDK